MQQAYEFCSLRKWDLPSFLSLNTWNYSTNNRRGAPSSSPLVREESLIIIRSSIDLSYVSIAGRRLESIVIFIGISISEKNSYIIIGTLNKNVCFQIIQIWPNLRRTVEYERILLYKAESIDRTIG